MKNKTNFFDLTVTPRLLFLLGILAGYAIQYPYIYWLKRTPVVYAEPISDSIYKKTLTKTFTIKNVPSWFYVLNHNANLRITTASSSEVNRQAHERFFTKNGEELVGFYDPIEHEVVCVNSTEVLVHELKHVFEYAWHQDPLQ